MALTDAQIDQVYKYLGYPLRGDAYDVWLMTINNTSVKHAINQLTTQGEAEVKTILTTMSTIETDLIDANAFFVVDKVGNININKSNADMLWGQYVQWAKRLALILHVPLSPALEELGSSGIGARVIG